MGYRKLVIWADETDEKLRKSLQSSGGKEIKQRENEGSIQIAYSYDLVDLSEMEKDVEYPTSIFYPLYLEHLLTLLNCVFLYMLFHHHTLYQLVLAQIHILNSSQLNRFYHL